MRRSFLLNCTPWLLGLAAIILGGCETQAERARRFFRMSGEALQECRESCARLGLVFAGVSIGANDQCLCQEKSP